MAEAKILEILLAAVVSLVAGSVWYSHLFFGKHWQVSTEVKEPTKFSVDRSLLLHTLMLFILEIMTATALMIIIGYSGLGEFSAALLCFLGFVGPILYHESTHEKQPLKLFFINASFRLVSLFLMASIFASF